MGLSILVSAAVGCVVGRLACFLLKDRLNVLRNVLCGVFGGFLGGFSVYSVNLSVYSWFFEIAVAAIGAFVFVLVIKITDRKRRG